MTSVLDLRQTPEELPPAPPKFPANAYEEAASYCSAYFEEAARAARTIDWLEVERASAMLAAAYTRGNHVYSCGNGGSAAIANHLQCDHVKGVRTGTDLTPRVVSLSSNVELLTAISNDIGYEDVFSYQLQSQAKPGDVLIAISSSGRSPNIVRALSWARENGLRSIALTGFGGGNARAIAEVAIHVDCTNYGVVEDLHQAAMHAMAQYIRQSRMSSASVAETTF
jgi:D-sedoheptulose 7-phosphate isomerase/D-glycero-D-manno-heptose 1,7-bisphosphate phosphatase